MPLGNRPFTEKRAYVRMRMDCPMDYRREGAPRRPATCLNLSVGGVLFRTDEPIDVGQRLAIHVTPTLPISPPLAATVEVLRVEQPVPGTYHVAGVITDVA